ncbi:holin [Lactobacillus murinus]|jgi:predicted transcriptional regulator|uniref:phage holin, LLH family n=1 Tax=Ligilactobacillus murinus TaxID=1622 RepID=UPI00188356C1|nr:phage holin, LLH family [Ligilactobacillus murinus]MBF0831349.1 holin [Ligilactobacillus murinus]
MEFNDVVVTVLVTVLTAVITFLGSEIKKNVRARTIFNVLEPLAKDAVVAAQKLGVTEYLSGAMKKNHAIKTVTRALLDAGFTVKDEQVIVNAVEQAYAKQRDLLKQYPQKEKED